MKIVNKIILSAVAAAALVFATACSNDYTVAEYEAGAKKVLNQAEINELIAKALGGGEQELTTYTADFSNMRTTAGFELDSSDPQKVTTDGEKKLDKVCLILSGAQKLRLRADGSVNYNGGTADAFASTTVGGTVAVTTLDRYVAIDTAKFKADSTITVSAGIKAVSSTSATDDTGIAIMIDEDGKILAVETALKLKTGTDTRTLTGEVAQGKKVYIGFSRGGAGAGGMDVTSLTANVKVNVM